jgi:hypothetical protein
LRAGWFLDARELDRSVDQTDMAERLRKISEHAPGTRVVFLGEQTEIILQREQALEKHLRIVETPLQDVIVRQPEAASSECALAGRQTFDAVLGVVAASTASRSFTTYVDGPG